MGDDFSDQPSRGVRIKAIADEAAAACERVQRHHIQRAEDAGYAKDALQYVGETIARIPDNMVPPEAENAVTKFRDYMTLVEQNSSAHATDIASHAYALTTNTSTTASMSTTTLDLRNLARRQPPKPAFWSQDRAATISARLARLDPDLATLFQSVKESFLAGISDAERRALYAMRDLFDRFFALIAPDDQVRASVYFKKKREPKEQQIERRERLLFAANERVQDNAVGQTLAANARYFLSIYKRLHKAHKRGELRREDVQETLRAAIALIEEWTEALEL
jgi:hypothetical protein